METHFPFALTPQLQSLFIVMANKDNILFSDIFDIKDVDGAGRKFDRGE